MRRALYLLLGLIGFVLLLLIVVIVALQFPATQDFVARRAESYLQGKLNTTVRIGKFRTDFRHAINLDDVYLADQKNDTLLAVGHLGVSIDIFALAKKQVSISAVELNDGRVRLTRTAPDSVNNYDFIIKAFTDPTAPVDTTSSGIKYNIGKARLTNIYFTQDDQITGSDLRARLGEVAVTMDEVDVDKSIYKVDEAALRRASILINQTKTAPEVDNPKPSEPLTLQFGLNHAVLDSVNFVYKNGPSAQFIDTRIGLADVTAKRIDLQKERVDLTKLTLKNTRFAYAQNAQTPVADRVVNPAEVVRKINEAAAKNQQAQAPASAPLSWRVTLAESDISGLDVAFDNFNEPKQKTRLPALDYNHLHFTDLVLNTHNLAYSANRTTAQVNNLAGKEKSGFRIDSWRANVIYDSVQVRLDSLDLITPHTRIRRTLAIGFQSLSGLSDPKQLAKMRVEGDLRNVRLGFRDILYLVPSLADTPPFNTGPNQSLLISGLVNGRVDDLTIRNLDAVALRGTVLKARRARITGLPNVDGRLYTDFDIQQFSTTRADILSLAPKGTIPANISVPPTLALSGTFRGRPTTLQFATNLQLNTTYGALAFSGDLGKAQASGKQPLVGTFAVKNFDFGKLLKDPQIGRVTASGRINATGNLQDPATLVGRVNATVQSARYNGYNYRGIATTVDIDRSKYTIKASSRQDPNLAFDLNGVVNLRNANNPAYAFNVGLKSVNLKALGFYDGDLRLQGNLKADLSGNSLNTIQGTFGGDNVVIVRDNQPFAFKTLQGRIIQTAARTAVEFDSDLFGAQLDGNVHLGDLAPELQQHLARYIKLPGVRYVATGADRHFTYSLALKDPKLATKLVAGLKEISPFTLAGEYSRPEAKLTATTSIPIIRYQNYRVDSLNLNVGSNAQKLDYALRLAKAAQDTTIKLRRPAIVGSVADNKVFARASILGDSANRERLALAGTLQTLDAPARRGQAPGAVVYQFEAAPEQILNYENWTAGVGNFVRYYPSGAVVADKLNLTNGKSTLAVQSKNPAQQTSPLDVSFNNFDLAELAKIVQQQDSLVAGTLNGTAELQGLGTPRLAFVADANVKGLVFQKANLGDLALRATNPSADRYDVDARLTGGVPAGAPNDVRLAGYYLTTPNSPSPLNFTLTAQRLNLKLVEPFSVGQVRKATGALTGELAVTGTPSAPVVRGRLVTTEDASFVVPQLGAPYRLPRQALAFDAEGIKFDNFTVLDSASNKAVANGYLRTKNFVDYVFDLRAVTDNFVAVNSTRKDNQLFYGRLVLDSDTRITGPLTLIAVNTKVTIVDGSRLTVESPTDDPAAVARDGIVKFVDKRARLDTSLARKVRLDTVQTGATGYSIAAQVTVTDRTPFTIVIDPVSGDNLQVRASGTLDTEIDPAGTITLSGRLTVARGKYHLSLFDLATRDFLIRRGSTINWSGDPYNADLNITAVYKVKAPPSELIAGQGADNAETASLARNPLDFNVLLNVTDQISKPAIGFDITLPENQRSGEVGGQVEARLAALRQPNQTSELSKQVFSLLILGRFVAQNPFQSSSGEGFVAGQLRGSASAVLTDQLQSLTGKYLSGLGLDLGVTNQATYGTDGSQGSRTDLNVAVRRQLLNNRLTVRVGTDIALGGSGTQNTTGASSASNLVGDVSLEYTLLRDGRLRLRAYRQNGYEDIDGPIVRTGAALVFQRDYNNLADLFAKVSAPVKQQRKESRQQEKIDRKAERDSVKTTAPRADSSRVK